MNKGCCYYPTNKLQTMLLPHKQIANNVCLWLKMVSCVSHDNLIVVHMHAVIKTEQLLKKIDFVFIVSFFT